MRHNESDGQSFEPIDGHVIKGLDTAHLPALVGQAIHSDMCFSRAADGPDAFRGLGGQVNGRAGVAADLTENVGVLPSRHGRIVGVS